MCSIHNWKSERKNIRVKNFSWSKFREKCKNHVQILQKLHLMAASGQHTICGSIPSHQNTPEGCCRLFPIRVGVYKWFYLIFNFFFVHCPTFPLHWKHSSKAFDIVNHARVVSFLVEFVHQFFAAAAAAAVSEIILTFENNLNFFLSQGSSNKSVCGEVWFLVLLGDCYVYNGLTVKESLLFCDLF